MNDILDRVSAIGIMPVITKIETAEDCDALAQALCDGGVPAMEITFRMKGADQYIRRMREQHPQMLIGAGTVITIPQAEQAIQAGAQFIVAPGLNPEIVRYCQTQNVDIIPGVVTPSEIEQAISLGLSVLKFFPAEQSGGIAAIKAICGPYSNIRFMPTGGLSLDKLLDYFAFDRVIACGGTYMLSSHLEKREWAQITQLCKQSIRIMLGLKLAHIGINSENETAAHETAEKIARLLLLDIGKDSTNSVFVERCIEVMKYKYLGKNGHIGFTTPSVDRTVRYLRAMGIVFNENSAKHAENGKLNSIYFKDEIGGFAIHLINA